MKISLIMPAGFNDPRRRRIHEWVFARWQALFPDWEKSIGFDDPENYSRSAARNRAVESCTGDMLVITDADTACNKNVVIEAIEKAVRGPDWVVAHTTYHSLTEEYTDTLLDGPPDIHLDGPFPSNWTMNKKSRAGVLVVPRPAFEKVGGYDERFLGWGYEDDHFAMKLDRLWGPYLRVFGPMLHLWHDPGENFAQPHIDHNRKLFEDARDAL